MRPIGARMECTMKKVLSVLLSLMLVLQLAACNNATTSTPSPSPSETTQSGSESKGVKVNGMLWEVEPLEEKTKLTVSYLANSTAELVTYLADQKGWLDAVNIEVDMVYFPGGPAQMEASNSWEVGMSGIGGIITGLLNYDVRVLGVVSRDRGLYQAFYARKDSPLVKSGTGHSSVEGIYGTADDWKKLNILTAKGTANQYTLYHTLKSFGLNLSDVKITNMDIASIPTAFLAGEGDVAGIQGLAIQDKVFQDPDSEYVLVSSDQMLKSGLSVNYVATGKAWETKQKAVETWLELAIMAGEYANANQQEAAEMMVDMYAIDGYETEAEANLTMIKDNPFIPLNENFQYFTEKNPEGTMLQAEAQIYDAMKGYVEMGNYSQEQLDKLLKDNHFYSDPLKKMIDRK